MVKNVLFEKIADIEPQPMYFSAPSLWWRTGKINSRIILPGLVTSATLA